MSTIAVFVALGGGAYAAVELPKDSVRSRQVKDGSLQAKDFKRGQLPRGAKGDRGLKGDPGARGEQGAAGPGGPAGPPGPGARTYAGQFENDGAPHVIATVDGVSFAALCEAPGGVADRAFLVLTGTSLYGWGSTRSGAGSTPYTEVFEGTEKTLGNDESTTTTDVVVTSRQGPERYVELHGSVVRASKCNYHLVLTPSQPAP